MPEFTGFNVSVDVTPIGEVKEDGNVISSGFESSEDCCNSAVFGIEEPDCDCGICNPSSFGIEDYFALNPELVTITRVGGGFIVETDTETHVCVDLEDVGQVVAANFDD